MTLEKMLADNKKTIAEKWFQSIVGSYPQEAQRFFLNLANPITNPVGSTINRGVEGALECLLKGETLESAEIIQWLDDIIRIRAVQDFTAARAVEFVFDLKKVVRKTVGGSISNSGILEELLTFESRIDSLALLAFNVYMQCREKVYELKTNELKRSTARLVRSACRVWESGERCSPEDLKLE